MPIRTKGTTVLIYGAGGYSGALIAREAVARGLDIVLGGRKSAALKRLGEELGVTTRFASLDDQAALTAALRDVSVVLHCAGPFSDTYAPMLEACLLTETHYLDISGEVDVVEALVHANVRAREIGCMVMPGVGLDVVAGDCLALHTANRVRGATQLSMGVHGLSMVSRGTAKTIIQAAGKGRTRRNGQLVAVGLGEIGRQFDFGWGPRPCMNVYWADVSTAYYTTGIPNIDVFCEANVPLRTLALSNRLFARAIGSGPWQAWANAQADMLAPGPDESQRKHARAVFVADAQSPDGSRSISRLHTPDGYTFTAMVAPTIAARAAGGDFEPGFQTPARVYGADFPLSFEDVVREDVQ